MAGPSQLDIVDLLGLEVAKLLIDVAGGQVRWIPNTMREEHWLVDAVGPNAALKLVERYGGTYLTIPKGDAEFLKLRNRQIRADRQAGMLVRDIAVRHHITMRQVFTILGSLEE